MDVVTHPFLSLSHSTATTEIYTLSLHDALPISPQGQAPAQNSAQEQTPITLPPGTQLALILTHPVDSKVMHRGKDRKSARQNASHTVISYAVFCLKKKKSESCPLQGS